MIPAPPENAVVSFNPPPGWSAPGGFDPRRGHLVDPAWPSAPEGWEFWVAASSAEPERATLPLVALPPTEEDAPKDRRRLVIILGVLAVGLGFAVWLGVSAQDDVPDVGSCWSGSGQRLNEVPCGSSSVDYVAVERTTSPTACPLSSDSYLEFGDAILCLEQH